MIELNKIYCENCLDTMKRMDDNFIDLTVTSPPYDNLREYNGFDFPFEQIANELYRVTKKGGVVVWVVGDATINGSETGTSFRQALYFKEIGFNLHDTMIYQKLNGCPLNHRKYESKFEFMFIFSKGVPKTFNPLMEKCVGSGKKNTGGSRKKTASSNEDSANFGGWGYGKDTKDKKIKGNIWSYLTGNGHSSNDAISFQHPATFPEKLPAEHIFSWSNEGGPNLRSFWWEWNNRKDGTFT